MVITDVWTSMGQEEERAAREAAFKGYCVDGELMAQAKPDAMVAALPACPPWGGDHGGSV